MIKCFNPGLDFKITIKASSIIEVQYRSTATSLVNKESTEKFQELARAFLKRKSKNKLSCY